MNVKINNYIITESYFSPEEYGEWYENHENAIQSISIVKNKKDYFDLIIDDNIDVDKPLYLVYAIYSQGNSFGCESGCIEYIKLFETLYEADLFKNELDKFEKYCQSNYKNYSYKPEIFEITNHYSFERSFKYFDEKFTLPWGGYFESLDSIEIIELKIINK